MKKYRLGLVVLAVVGIGLGIAGASTISNQHKAKLAAAHALDPKYTILAKCPSLSGSQEFNCYQSYLTALVYQKGAEASLSELDRLSKSNSYVLSQCHPLVHQIGRAAYIHYGSVQAATDHGSELCWSGYYHGIMESYMAGFDDTKLMSMMPTICKQDPKKPYSFDYYNCLHGLGHGVTIRFSNDIFKALPFCKALVGSWQQQSCYSGVFMQNIVVDGVEHTSVDTEANDPIYPCNVVEQDEKTPCYLMVTSQILKYTNYDYSQAFAWCGKVDTGFLDTCYQSMGRDISGDFLLDRQKIMDYCKLGGTAAEPDCIIGAVKNDVFNDRNTVKANALCAGLEPSLRATCATARDEAASTI